MPQSDCLASCGELQTPSTAQAETRPGVPNGTAAARDRANAIGSVKLDAAQSPLQLVLFVRFPVVLTEVIVWSGALT